MIRGFEAIAAPDARILVLGTIPSQRSLQAGEYYAHTRNAFWFIMERLFAQQSGLDYAARKALLIGAKVALWDVLHAAERPGSLDSAIVAGSENVNDFASFFVRHRGIRTVFFNGAKARDLFRRHVLGTISPQADLRFVCLPSTSPANARLTREAKLTEWRALLESLAVR
jgi:TDG/mug DNA glycosylase family protein